MEIAVYSKNSEKRCVVTSLEYNGEWMSECSVTFDLDSPEPVDFKVGDWLEYRGERFELHYEPEVTKTADSGTYGAAYKYKRVKFLSLAEEMVNCDFLDYVLNDNLLHFSGLPDFSFYADTVQDLADRIQANMNRYCEQNGLPQWSIEVAEGTVGEERINISVSNISCFDALALVNSEFGLNYTIKGRRVVIGGTGIPVSHVFKLGKDYSGKVNGLYELTRSAESDQKIVTRLRAYGSGRNLPRRYYNSLTDADGVKVVPDNMSINRLMLPSFPYETLDPYIDSGNIEELGVIEDTVTFDGTDELEEIYPSIEGATAEELRETGFDTEAEGRLDEILSAQQVTDNGEGYEEDGNLYPGTVPEGGTTPDILTEDMVFRIRIKDIGFDIMDYLTDETPQISFKSGMLGGRDFEICTDDSHKPTRKFDIFPGEDGQIERTEHYWEVTLKRVYDDSIQLWFPYERYNAREGDRFVILGIDMPDTYIKMASQRLLVAATEWLKGNDYARSVYTPEVDEMYMASQHQEYLEGKATESYYLTIKEGDLLMFEEESLYIGLASIFIDKLTIKEGDGPVPTYEVTLREEKVVGTLQRIQNQIDSLKSGGYGNGGSGGYNAEQIKQLIKAFGEQFFIMKIKPDATPYDLTVGGVLYAIESLLVGRYLQGESGAMVNRQGDAEIRSLLAREYARILGDLFVGDYIEGQTGAHMDFDGNTELGSLLVRLDSVFNGALSSQEFISGFLDGKGWALTPSKFINASGKEEIKYTLELDNLIVRNTMRIYELIVSQLVGENDNRVFTAMLEVDHYDPETGKVWLDTQSGKFYNPFRKGDYIMVQQFNGLPDGNGGNYITKHYEFIVTEVGLGDLSLGVDRLDWIEFEAFIGTTGDGNPQSLIAKGDSITRVDSLTDPERKGLIQIITVGSKTPYLDVVYGLKTDPDNALKARLGNLQGIRHHLFGWLQGWGLYSENAYLVGDFRLRNTGDSVEAEIQMLKDRFSSQYSEISYDVTEDDNLLYNPAFTDNLTGWEIKGDTTAIIWDDYSGDGYDGGLLMNGNLYLSEGSRASWAMLDDRDGRRMLHIFNSGISQDNGIIKEKMTATGKSLTHWEYDTDGAVSGNIYDTVDDKGKETKADADLTDGTRKEVANTLYLSIRFLPVTSGKLTIGFDKGGGTLPHTDTLEISQSSDWQTMEWQGTWDGRGDFTLGYTGEIWVQLLSLTDDPLGDYKEEAGTLIEQTSRNIKLMAYNVKGNARQTASLQIWANKIEAEVYDSGTGMLSRITQTERSVSTLVTNVGNFTEKQFQELRNNVSGIEGSVSDIEKNLGEAEKYIDGIRKALVDNDGRPIEWSDFVLTSRNASLRVNEIYGDLYPAEGNGWVALKEGLLDITSDFTQLGNLLVKSDELGTLVRQAGFLSSNDAASLYATQTYVNEKTGETDRKVAAIETRVSNTEASISQKVDANGVIAAINLTAQKDGSQAVIQADKISLKGYTEINNFVIDEIGDVTVSGNLTAEYFSNKINTNTAGQINGSIITNQSPSGTMVLPTLKSGEAILVRVMMPYVRKSSTGTTLDALYEPPVYDIVLMHGGGAAFTKPERVTTDNLFTHLHLPRYGGCFIDLFGVSGAKDGGDLWYVVPQASDNGNYILNNSSII